MTYPQRPKILIPRDQINREVCRIADEIARDYQGKYPLMLGILKGSFVFMSDLVRTLAIPVEIDFVRLSSYGPSKVSSGNIRLVHGLSLPVKDRDIIIVDDIVDTGLATNYLMNYIKKRKPASLKICAFLDKPSRREAAVPIDYRGIVIPDRFVVGYGLDYAERYRDLPDICTIEE